jgi:hypothetical protein
VIDDGSVAHVDLPALHEAGHRDHHRELVRVSLEVVRHGDHRALAVAHEHHLGGAVEQAAAGPGDVEAAEGAGVAVEQQRQGDQRGQGEAST